MIAITVLKRDVEAILVVFNIVEGFSPEIKTNMERMLLLAVQVVLVLKAALEIAYHFIERVHIR